MAQAAPLEPAPTRQRGLRTREGSLRPSAWLAAAALAFALAWAAAVAWPAADAAVAGWVGDRLDGEAQASWRAASWPGATVTGLALTGAGALACLAVRERRAAAATFGLGVIELGAVQAVKALVARERPAGAVLDTHAFPSGHAATAMVAWGLLALVVLPALARHIRFTPLARRFAVGVWLGIAAAAGVARVLGGVHWASDVVAGWAFGGAVLVLAVRLARTDRPPPRALSADGGSRGTP